MLRAFGHRVPMCCDMLGVVGSSLKMVKFEPTTPNMSQHIATRWPNARNMLRSFGRGFTKLFFIEQALKLTRTTSASIHSQREIEVMSSTLKISPFSLAQSIKLHIRALVLIPCLIPCHRCEKSARESRNSHHLITRGNNIHVRAPDMCVYPRGYMTSGWRNLF